jgi:hypothetical protein
MDRGLASPWLNVPNGQSYREFRAKSDCRSSRLAGPRREAPGVKISRSRSLPPITLPAVRGACAPTDDIHLRVNLP